MRPADFHQLLPATLTIKVVILIHLIKISKGNPRIILNRSQHLPQKPPNIAPQPLPQLPLQPLRRKPIPPNPLLEQQYNLPLNMYPRIELHMFTGIHIKALI